MRYRFDKNRIGLMIHVWEEFVDVLKYFILFCNSERSY